MKKSIFLATTGLAGLLLGAPQNDAKADVELLLSMGCRGTMVAVSDYPNFMYLDDYGFYVSYGWD